IQQTVAKFRRGGKHRPLVATRPAEQHEGQGRRAIGKRWHPVCGFGMKGAPERKAEPAYSTDQSLKSSGRVHNRPAAMDRLRAFSLAKGAPRSIDESISGLTGKFSLGRCWSMTSKKTPFAP